MCLIPIIIDLKANDDSFILRLMIIYLYSYSGTSSDQILLIFRILIKSLQYTNVTFIEDSTEGI